MQAAELLANNSKPISRLRDLRLVWAYVLVALVCEKLAGALQSEWWRSRSCPFLVLSHLGGYREEAREKDHSGWFCSACSHTVHFISLQVCKVISSHWETFHTCPTLDRAFFLPQQRIKMSSFLLHSKLKEYFPFFAWQVGPFVAYQKSKDP